MNKPIPQQIDAGDTLLTVRAEIGGRIICAEEIVGNAAVLRTVLAGYLDTTGSGLDIEPLTYPEAKGLYELASTVYLFLAKNTYGKQIAEAEKRGRPSFI